MPFVIFIPALILVLVIWGFIFLRARLSDKKRIAAFSSNPEEKLSAEDLWLEMARSYEKAGNIEKALEHYELYIYKKNPQDPELYHHVGNLFGKDALKEAFEYWKRAADMGYQPAIEVLNSLNNQQEENRSEPTSL